MAEYIDKNMINERMLEYAVISGLNHHKMSAFILNIPTADVIERYKIDKAIEQTYKVREEVLHSNTTYEPNDVLEIIDKITAYFEEL